MEGVVSFFQGHDVRTSPGCFSEHSDQNMMILYGWMEELREHFGVGYEPLHMALSIFRHTIARSEYRVPTGRLQLFGVTAFWIACKYNGNCPSALAMSMITNNTYTSKEVIKCEAFILKTIEWRCSTPTLWMTARYNLGSFDEGQHSALHIAAILCNVSSLNRVTSAASVLEHLIVVDDNLDCKCRSCRQTYTSIFGQLDTPKCLKCQSWDVERGGESTFLRKFRDMEIREALEIRLSSQEALEMSDDVLSTASTPIRE